MHSHLSQTLAAERSRELRDGGLRASLNAQHVGGKQPDARPARIARLRIRFARLTARFAETGS
jgi:hypothetical protein